MAEATQHTINLRKVRGFAFNKKAAVAMRLIREHISQHTKADQIKISPSVNHAIWVSGKRNVPQQLTVQVTTQENTAYVEMPDQAFTHPDLKEETQAKEEESATVDKTEAETDSQATRETTTMTSEEEISEQVQKQAEAVAEQTGEQHEVTETTETETQTTQTDTQQAREEQEETDETVDLPDALQSVLRDGNITDAKEQLQQLNKEDMEKALTFEKQHQNRKGVIQFIESNMR